MRVALTCLAAILTVILVYAAIPFFCIPTPGEIVWTSGFAKSFINAGWPSIEGVNFGIPGAAPIPFGLAGALFQSGLMFLFRLNAIDAYAFGAVTWLAIALLGCISLARFLGASGIDAPFLSLMYLTLPIIWWHASFAMLSFGFALLPLYLVFALRLIYDLPAKARFGQDIITNYLPFILVSLLAIFIDGYTYVMFLVAAGCFYFIAIIRGDVSRARLALITAPVLLLAIILSYVAYTRYLGVRSFDAAPMDVFRGWGVDVVMMLIPSQGVSWLCDACHLSVPRSDQEFFGDASVWMTTFSAPLLVLGAWGFFIAKRHHLAVHLLCISLLGFYFALGPSLKVNSRRPPSAETMATIKKPSYYTMPKNLALISTGSAIFSEHLPGFKSMRAAYRWSGLLFVGLFGLTVLLVRKFREGGKNTWAYFIPSLVILVNLPDLPREFADNRENRKAMEQMRTDLQPLNDYLGQGSRVVFYPQGNDFLVNYLSAEGRYYTYNVGGDKNIELASRFWPQSIREFFAASVTDGFDQEIAKVLLSRNADHVVIPYFDTLVNASAWPPAKELLSERRTSFAPAIVKLSQDPRIRTKDDNLYTVFSLKIP
jgi:hypothetical protein